jgi:multidrug efflux pump
MFGMVLAIGILVDDAIVVVENVERIMVSEGLSPKEATRKAMGQITGAIIGITWCWWRCFCRWHSLPGSVGVIYQQFSLSMATSILFSAFLALTLTPALCATLLKPIAKDEHHTKGGFFGWFNRRFERLTDRYEGWVAYALKRSGRYLLIYLVLLVGLGLMFSRLPSSFLPVEDQGYTITDIQLPPGASKNRTVQVAEQIEAHNAKEPGVGDTTMIMGFSFSGSGQNAALAFTTLKDWSQRSSDDSAAAIADRANMAFTELKDAIAYAILPPPVDGLGTSSGFEFRLQDRGGVGHAALMAARTELLDAAGKSPILANVRESALAEAPQVQLQVDRKQANALGVSFADVGNVLSSAIGSTYVNDFPNQGRMQRVVVQAEGDQRSQVADLLKINVRNKAGEMVPLSAFVVAKWTQGPTQLTRYNGYPAIAISGEAAPGHSTGEAMEEIQRLVNQLPAGLGQEWTGLSLQERLSGSQAPLLLGLSLLIVFLCLAALYESWSIPTSVLLVVPLGVLGAAVGRDLARHAQRCVLQGRADHHHRPVGEERDPDHRVRQGPVRAGRRLARRNLEGRAAALAADHHDLAGVHPRRGAPGDCHRRQFGEPASDRYGGDRRDDHRDAGGGVCAGVLCGRHEAGAQASITREKMRYGAHNRPCCEHPCPSSPAPTLASLAPPSWALPLASWYPPIHS